MNSFSLTGITATDKTMLHLMRFYNLRNEITAPINVSQFGIAKKVGIRRTHVSRAVKKLIQMGYLIEKTAHIHGLKRSVKVYFPTEIGLAYARDFYEKLMESIIKVKGLNGAFEEHKLSYIISKLKMDILDIVRIVETDGMIDYQNLMKEKEEKKRLVYVLEKMPSVSVFFDRERELGKIKKWFWEKPVVIIYGLPGIGKTTLAAKFAIENRNEYNIYWHKIEDWDTSKSVLSSLAEFFDLLGKNSLSNYIKKNKDIELADVSNILKELFLELPKTLLIFDDFHKAYKDKVRKLFSLFISLLINFPGNVKILVLTRELIPFYDVSREEVRRALVEFELRGLDEQSSKKIISAELNDEEFHTIYELTEGNPLLLEIIDALVPIEIRSNAFSLRSAGIPPLKKDVTFLNQKLVKRYIHEQILSNLTDNEKKILERVVVHRIPFSSSAFFLEQDENYEIIDGLVAKSILAERDLDLYEMHEFIRAFLYSRATSEQRKKAHLKAVEYYLGNEYSSKLEKIYHLFKGEAFAKGLEFTIENYDGLLNAGYGSELLSLLDNVDLQKIEDREKVELHYLKAEIFLVLGEFESALENYRACIAIGENILKEERLANLFAKIGLVSVNIGELKNATESYEKALEFAKKSSDEKSIAKYEITLGEIYGKINYEKAIEHYNKGLEFYIKGGEEQVVASIYTNLGNIYSEIKDLNNAKEVYEALAKIYEKFCQKQQLADVYFKLGEIYNTLGKEENGKNFFSQALKIYEEIGDIEKIKKIEKK
ncbi:MAG: tetratricopeptide repeat protein [Candidatus Thermoplasmatota archaeon]